MTTITPQQFQPATCGRQPEQCQATPRKKLGLLNTLKKWHQNSRGRQALGSLSDDMLKDIGVTRSDADIESEKPFWKD